MSGNVISLAKAREEREPHWAGSCICLGCRHEWTGVGPVGVTVCLDCPSCGLSKGVLKYLFGAQEGDLVFECSCGCEAMTIYKRRGRFYTKCMACGTDQTAAVYGEAL